MSLTTKVMTNDLSNNAATKALSRRLAFPCQHHHQQRTMATTGAVVRDMMGGSRGGSHQYQDFFRRHQRFLTSVSVAGVGLGMAQYTLGEAENFFDYKFVTKKQPHDLADFYGTEDFMEIFSVFPMVQDFMMRKAVFGDDGTIHAWGLLGPENLDVSIDFDEREEDTDGDGEPDTITWFNKRENFCDHAPDHWPLIGGFTLWNMTQNFGYNRKEDGTCVVYHQGEKFSGLFPIRLVFQLHARYVIWATERYVNSEAFGSEELGDQAEVHRHNVPLHVFNQFIEELTTQVEKAKSNSQGDAKKQRELDVTLQRLHSISKVDHGHIRPRLSTLKSRKSNISHSHLVVDDAETKDAIRTAMNQIAAASSSSSSLAAASGIRRLSTRTTSSSTIGNVHPEELRQLQRRLTLRSMKPEETSSATTTPAAGQVDTKNKKE